MELILTRIRRVPRTKAKFIVDFVAGGVTHRTRATVLPKRGPAVDFAEDEIKVVLFKTGRKVRYLCSAIIAAYRGEKLHLPMEFSDQDSSLSKNFRLTVSTSQEAALLVGTG